MKYIDADRLREKLIERLGLFEELSSDTISPIRIDECKKIIGIINSLQQESEVDLAEKIEKYYYDNFDYITSDQPTLSILTNIARHFYELGQRKAAEMYDEVEYNRQLAESRIMTREMIEGRLLQNDTESWNEDYNEEDLQTRFAFYTYKDEPGVLYLSNLFVEEASRKQGLGTKILEAAERVAETIGAITIGLKVKQGSPANAWYRKNGYGYVASEYGYDWLEKKLNSM